MKYAICLRGISYCDSYQHNEGIPPYKIDFNDTIDNFEQYFLNSLRKNGHEVDVYFSTYNSPYLQSYCDRIKPKQVRTREYVIVPPGTPSSVFNGVIESLEMVLESKCQYDFIIITRFDLIWLQPMVNLYLEPNAMSIVSPGDDNFIAIDYKLIYNLLYHYKWLRGMNFINHYFAHEFIVKGNKIHLFFEKEPVRGFCMTSRNVFINKDHPWYMCDYSDVFNEQSSRYIKPTLPLTKYNPMKQVSH